MLDFNVCIVNNADMHHTTRRVTKVQPQPPRAIKSVPRSRRLYDAISEAAEREFMSRGAWMLKLASTALGVLDKDDIGADAK